MGLPYQVTRTDELAGAYHRLRSIAKTYGPYTTEFDGRTWKITFLNDQSVYTSDYSLEALARKIMPYLGHD